jgi:hypothetical protein
MSLFVRKREFDASDVSGEAPSLPHDLQLTGNRRLDADLRLLPLVCAIAVLWLVTRHYFGVVADARFYALEALRELEPNRFAKDLYFQFGSQGSFSLFTELYRPIVAHFGLSAAGMGVAVAGQLLWLFALFALARNLAGDRFLWLAVAVVIAMPNSYAPYFGYGEAIATPRLFAEGLTMLALAQLRSRPAWTLVLLGCATALHPLMALPGLVAAYVYLALGRPLWWALAPVGLVLAAALAWMGVAPFSNLHKALDPEWFSVVSVRSLQCLLTRWPSDTYFQALNGLAWGVVGLFTLEARQRRFLAAVLAAGIGGLVATLIGGDIARNVLVVELQPWRSMWLLLLVVRIFIPVIFFSLLAKRISNAFAIAVFLSIVMILVSSVTKLVRLPNSADFDAMSLGLALVALAALFARHAWTGHNHRRLGQVISCLVIVATPVAAWGWDGRTPWTRQLESPEPAPAELTRLLPPSGSVYWENSTEMLWFRLKRSSYFSCDQGTGVVFHRETAMAYKHRSDSFWPLRTADFTNTRSCAAFDKGPKPERTRAGLQKLCRREPGLDAMVLIAPVPGVMPKVWKSPILFQDIHVADGIYTERSTDRFYIYACADLR